MKKLILKFSLIVILLVIPANLSASECTKNVFRISQSNVYDAYMYQGGNWHTGRIVIEQTQNGYRLISYNFSDVSTFNGQPLQGRFYDGERLTPLNPNNELAKKNNFTHYIEIQGIRAYIVAN